MTTIERDYLTTNITGYWNRTDMYSRGQMVEYNGGAIYRSLTDNNIGNDPAGPDEEAVVWEICGAEPIEESVPEKSSTASDKQLVRLPLSQIVTSDFNPRSLFDEDGLKSLADSIRSIGVLQPITVRRHPLQANKYEIVAGERRYHASELAGLDEIDAIIVEMTDESASLNALLENIQRVDLNPLERAKGLDRLVTEFGWKQQDLGEKIGLSQSSVANSLRLLRLPPDVQSYLKDGRLSEGHGIQLLSLDDPNDQRKYANEAVIDNLPVSKLRSLVTERKAAIDARNQPPLLGEGDLLSPRQEAAADSAAEDSIQGKEEDVDHVQADDEGDPVATDGAAEEAVEGESGHGDSELPGETPEDSTVAPDQQAETGTVPPPDTAEPPVSASAPAPVVDVPPATPAPKAQPPAAAAAPAAPPTIPGFINAMVKKEDYDWFLAEELWPLANAREQITSLRAESGELEIHTPPISPAMALVSGAAQELAQINATSASVFAGAETDLLNELFPGLENVGGEHILAVLVTKRLRGIKEIN